MTNPAARGKAVANRAADISTEGVAGALNLVRGARILMQQPKLFLLGAVPPAIMSIVFVVLLIWLISQLGGLAEFITPFAHNWNSFARAIIEVLAGFGLLTVTLLVMIVSFSTLTLALGAPVYDKISEAVDATLPGGLPETGESWVVSIPRSLLQSVILIAISLVGAIPLFLAQFIPVVGQFGVPVVAACFGGWLLCFELIGPSLERRGVSTLRQRRVLMQRRRWRSLGFAVPCYVLLAIPFVAVLVFPIATAGGVLLSRDLVADEQPPESSV